MNPHRTVFWGTTARWTGVGLVLVSGYFALAGIGSPSAIAVGLPEWTAVLVSWAALAGGLAFAREADEPASRSSVSELLRAALLTAVVAYVLIAFVQPWLSYTFANLLGTAPAGRFPLGAETPSTLWRMRSHTVEFGLAGDGPITPEIWGQLSGFEFYYGMAIPGLVVLNAVTGHLIGSLGRDSRPGMTELLTWLCLGTIVGSLVYGVRIAVALLIRGGWSAEAVAILPVIVPLIITGALWFAHAATYPGGRESP